MTSVAWRTLDGRFALTGSYDHTARLWHIEYVDKTLSLLDHLLILKLTRYQDRIMNDSQAVDCLKTVLKKPDLNPQAAKLIEALFYKMRCPEQECRICTEKYDPTLRNCVKLLCCQKSMCNVCLNKLHQMSHEQSVRATCPFCLEPIKRWRLMGLGNEFASNKKDTHS